MGELGKLVTSIVGCELVGLIGSIYTMQSLPWYALLHKPSFNPPNWVFGPVWIFLYFLMGLSLYFVWTKKSSKKTLQGKAYLIFVLQLIFNVLWSIVFFGLHNIFGAFIVIIILWFLIIETIRQFAKVDQFASMLLYPYLAWVTFATALNFAIWVLNQ